MAEHYFLLRIIIIMYVGIGISVLFGLAELVLWIVQKIRDHKIKIKQPKTKI